ncbi:MAG: hypothetical protein ACE5JL_04835 [Dehalococcoidia bacterium]
MVVVLMRAFSRLGEDGTIAVPSNIQSQAELEPNCLVEYKVLRLKDTGRRPHMLFHSLLRSPYLSPMEAVMMHGVARMVKGKIVLDDTIREEARLEPGDQVELKVLGPYREHWVVAYNRGPGLRRRRPPKTEPKRVVLEY